MKNESEDEEQKIANQPSIVKSEDEEQKIANQPSTLDLFRATLF